MIISEAAKNAARALYVALAADAATAGEALTSADSNAQFGAGRLFLNAHVAANAQTETAHIGIDIPLSAPQEGGTK